MYIIPIKLLVVVKSAEQVAHKVAWAAVKNKYEKQGGTWVEKYYSC